MTAHAEPTLSPRRRQLVEAALHVVAEHGLRGLTHRAVDRGPGCPRAAARRTSAPASALQCALTEYVAGDAGRRRRRAGRRPALVPAGDDERAVELTGASSRAGSTSASCCWPGWSCRWRPPRDPELAGAPGAPGARGSWPRRGRAHGGPRARSTAARAPRRSWRRSTASCSPRCSSPARAAPFLVRSLDLLMAPSPDLTHLSRTRAGHA